MGIISILANVHHKASSFIQENREFSLGQLKFPR